MLKFISLRTTKYKRDISIENKKLTINLIHNFSEYKYLEFNLKKIQKNIPYKKENTKDLI